jgi:DNA repair protein RecN (Recombination protein N)
VVTNGMLAHLFVRDLAIIKTLELELSDGLIVLTGETGAGKSIVIDALALALGERAESLVVRPGAKRAEVSASFSLKADAPATAWLRENELYEDGECVLRRVVEVDKPSKAYINGRPVPVQQLRALGELLVDIHGQHEHQSLLKRDIQQDLLDAYGGLGEPVAQLRRHYEAWRALNERLETLRQESADREGRIEFLRHQAQELRALNLKPGELAQLEEEHARLAHGAELLAGVQDVAQSVYDAEEGAAGALLARARSRLEALTRFDPKLAEIGELLAQAVIQIDEAAGRLHDYLDRLELDPNRLQWLESRLGTLHDLARKHRLRPEELAELLARLEQELGDLENYDVNLARLESELKTARAAYDKLAAEISRGRAQAAKKLGKAVSDRMQELGMPGGKFEIALGALPRGEIGARGLERTEFLVSANPGQPPRPLPKVASGGELSRISLALQVVLAGLASVPTLIFDEVDVGVGGRVAEIVGQLLRDLGRHRQVFVITHLAQVAALGHHHLRVSKSAAGGETTTELHALKGGERVQEIARMIGGVTISPKTLAHAEDMLARATA